MHHLSIPCSSPAWLLALSLGPAALASESVEAPPASHYSRTPLPAAVMLPSNEWHSTQRYPDFWFDGPEGLSFAYYLAEGYRYYAKWEDHVSDFASAQCFSARALAVERGEPVAPEALEARQLPAYALADLSLARQQLMQLLARQAAQRLPKLTAQAQVLFDCWMEQQEENLQPHDVAACRNGLALALCRLEQALAVPGTCYQTPRPQTAATHAQQRLLYFELDQTQLTPDGQATLQQLLQDLQARPARHIRLQGHTDLAGSLTYNDALSARRVEVIQQALRAGGVPATTLSSAHYGKTHPRVPTPDGVRLQENRRVEVWLEYP